MSTRQIFWLEPSYLYFSECIRRQMQAHIKVKA